MSAFIQVMTTAPSADEAQRIARRLVETRLAACVQVVGPIRSTYRWRGAVESAEEWLCIAKARAERFEEVRRAIAAGHSYEVPEIVAAPIVAASASYLAWLEEEARAP